MSTAEELEGVWAAELGLFGGSPVNHEGRMMTDPAYRAAHQAKTRAAFLLSHPKPPIMTNNEEETLEDREEQFLAAYLGISREDLR